VNAQWGIYIKCLETGEEIVIDADRQMDTMSVIKISPMVEVFRQIGEGRFSLAWISTENYSPKREPGFLRPALGGQTQG
jgi:beta-lactamase class A